MDRIEAVSDEPAAVARVAMNGDAPGSGEIPHVANESEAGPRAGGDGGCQGDRGKILNELLVSAELGENDTRVRAGHRGDPSLLVDLEDGARTLGRGL